MFVKLAVALAVFAVLAGSAFAASTGDGVRCSSDGSVTTCTLKNAPPLAYSVSISTTEVLVIRNGPPGPTRVVFRVAQP